MKKLSYEQSLGLYRMLRRMWHRKWDEGHKELARRIYKKQQEIFHTKIIK
jgi:hypothetical protein